MNEPRLILKPGREKSVLRRHPWLFSGAIQRIEGDPQPGDIGVVVAGDNRFLARGILNPRSQIIGRLLSWNAEQMIDEAFWRERLVRSIEARPEHPDALRWVHGESDGLPGLIVDRYGPWVVMQVLSAGIERVKPLLTATLKAQPGVCGVYERSDAEARRKEGLEPVVGVLAGDAPEQRVVIHEPAAGGQSLALPVDLMAGHKTGAYLDQRENRRRMGPACAGGEVLNAFAYSGGFALHALAAGARRVVNLDDSADALALAREAYALNGLDVAEEDFVVADVFKALREMKSAGQRFDVIILDPPKFVAAAPHMQRGTRAYKDINRLAMGLLRPGGRLATFSCSGLVSADLFQKIIFSAGLEAEREAVILERYGQPIDHPVAINFPEGEYLKGMLLRVS